MLLATGLIEETGFAQTSDLKEVGDSLYLVGQTAPALGGSLWARRRGRRGLPTPPVDPRRVRLLGDHLVDAGGAGEVRAAHDVSDGGLAVALPEMAFGGGLGFDVELAATGLTHPALAAVAEGGSRWVVEVPSGKTGPFERRFRGLPVARLGRVTAGGGHFAWQERTLADVELTRLYAGWRTGLGLP